MTMDKKIAGLLGAVGALPSLDTAQATIRTDSTTMLKAQSYADLLNPIPNAAAILKAADEAGDTSGVRVAENAHHHHHHHRHSYRRERKIINCSPSSPSSSPPPLNENRKIIIACGRAFGSAGSRPASG